MFQCSGRKGSFGLAVKQDKRFDRRTERFGGTTDLRASTDGAASGAAPAMVGRTQAP